MLTITLDINKGVNPCILKVNGQYAPVNHQLYITCDENSVLYSQYGWYLGSIFISSPDLQNIKKDDFSLILKEIDSNLNLVIKENLENLKARVFSLVYDVVREINQKLVINNQIQITTDYLKI